MFLILAVYLHFVEGYNTSGSEHTIATLIKSFAILPLKDHPWYEVGWTLEHEVIFYVIAGIVLSFSGRWVLCVVLLVAGMIGIVFNGILPAMQITRRFWDWHLLDPTQLEFAAGLRCTQRGGSLRASVSLSRRYSLLHSSS